MDGISVFKPGGVDTGWHYTGICADRSSNLKLTRDVPQKAYPLSFLFCTDMPFKMSDIQHSRGVYVPTSGYEFSADNCFPSNLLNNPDFENWTNGIVNTAPDGWEINDTVVSITRVSWDKKTGTYAAFLTFDGTAGGANNLFQYAPFEVGETYLIGVWLKVSGITAGGISLNLVDDSGVLATAGINIDCDWTFLNFTYTFDTEPSGAFILLEGWDVNNGAACLVDVAVITKLSDYEKNTFGNPLTTSGKVAVTPSIEVVAAYLGASGPSTGASYTMNDNGNTWSTRQTSYQLNYIINVAAVSGISHRIDVAKVKQWTENASHAAWVKVTLTPSGGSETTLLEYSTTVLQANMILRDSVTYGTAATTLSANTGFDVKVYVKASSGSYSSYAKYMKVTYTEVGGSVFTPATISIYNKVDTLTKFNLDSLIPGSRIRVNPVEGTGKYIYSDDFSTNQSSFLATDHGTVTWSKTTKTINITDTSYRIYPFAVKLPIQGIPYLVLYVSSGYPQVLIAADNGGTPGTFYAVDNNPITSITNDIWVYSLNNAANLQLASSNKFYIKIIPPGGQTCTISSIQMFVSLQAIYIDMPQILLGPSNTFKVDMAGNTPCYVSLFWEDWKWGI